MRYIVFIFSALLIFSCHKHDHDHDHAHKDGKHDDHNHGEGGCNHPAPKGGSMVTYGNDFGFLELLLNKETGEMSGYIYTGCSLTPHKIKDETITLNLELEGEKNQLILKAQENELTKEKVGDSYTFMGQSDWLKGKDKFDVWVQPFTIKGVKQKEKHFVFPDAKGAHSH